MQPADATAMILAESTPYPDLMRLTSLIYDRYTAGSPVDYTDLSAMFDEASGKGVLRVLHAQDEAAFNEMVLVLGREIDRQAPIKSRRYAH